MGTVKENNWFWIVQRLGGKCARCGSIENLQVDHVDPRTKKFEVKSRLSYKRIKLRRLINVSYYVNHVTKIKPIMKIGKLSKKRKMIFYI